MLAYKCGTRIIDHEYENIMRDQNIMSLKQRRDVHDLTFLVKLIQNKIYSPELLGQINFKINSKNTRSVETFNLKNHRTNLEFKGLILTSESPIEKAGSTDNTSTVSEHTLENVDDEMLEASVKQASINTTDAKHAEDKPSDQDVKHTASQLNRMHLRPKIKWSERRRLKREQKKAEGTWTEQKPKKQASKETPQMKGVKTSETVTSQRKAGPSGVGTPGNRPRSEETTPTKDAVKKPRVNSSESLAIKMAVWLEGYPENKLTDEDANNLQEKMLDFIRPLENGNGPQFNNCRQESGVLVMTCVNQATQKWLIDCVTKIGKCGEIKLEVGVASKVLNTTKVITRLPKVMKDHPMEKVLQRLEVQNNDIKTEDWRLINTKTESNVKTVVFLINEEELGKLKERGLSLYLGLEKIQFSIIEKKARAGDPGPESTS
ncbi:uncharacterized protein LOC113469653 [Diaphorina citri]|uniref:Uncharacterized protein LOC113469653 n=1 Tax=Diaphorina citri TaxID=121845 RepID=A0A3Q0J4G7_DIACI|nr:uncharacterized protein LOC113469653 [Diaphorina citri]